MEDTSGFYKNDNGQLLFGKNYVLSGSYNLYRDQKNNYTYPLGGWYWFESEEEARVQFNIPAPVKENDLPHWSELKPPIGLLIPPTIDFTN